LQKEVIWNATGGGRPLVVDGMPPAKVKIERIEGNRTRQNTYQKRKLGWIKKAIELTVLCDCDVAIILRSGPTITCRDGKLTAYCNKDLETMLKECLAELPVETYNNSEYTPNPERYTPNPHRKA